MPWSDIKSQPLVSNLLQRSLKSGRMHQGYMFVGDESETEKMASALAQALNCEKPGGDFCGKCASCISIIKQQHPDIYAVKPESKSRRIIIDQIREVERAVFLKATMARFKVAIIHSADRLQPEAQDAFLKTLEEPPAKTIFLLLTEEPQQLKETILSRCLRVPFRPATQRELTDSEKKVQKWLDDFTAPICEPQSKVMRAYGFVGNVLSLLKEMKDQRLEEAEKALDDDSLDNLEASQRERLREQLEAQAQADYLHDRNQVLRRMLAWYHDHSDDTRALEIIEKLSRRLSRNVNESLAWEVTMLELTSVGKS
jgi:DNA polymerase III subunit delta'